MKRWLSIIAALTVQELIATDVVLLDAFKHDYSVWLVSLIFVLATAFIIAVGFYIGKWVQKRFVHSKIVNYSAKKAQKFESFIGPLGSRFALIFLGFVNFNYINAFLASWLSLSFGQVFIYLFLGDIIWYALVLIVVFGVNTFIDPTYAVYLIIGISFIISGLALLVQRKIVKKGNL